MPLEATMILIDNSEYMRNGDYQPTRFEAQSDAVNSVFQAKTDSNPENLVGLMTMAGKGPEVLVTNSKDLGQILKAIHAATSKVGGATDIPTAISVAQLALKHRQNKNLRQRIVVFVGSPLQGDGSDEKSMVKLAKKLKKNNVAVDVIAFGEGIDDGTSTVLKAFVDNAASGENSHFLAIPPGPHLLSDMVNTSPVLAEDRGYTEGAFGDEAGPSTGGAAGGFEFGVDPSLDPELAAALRMSLEEEQARQAAAAQASGAEPAPAAAAPSAPAAEAASATVPAEVTDDEEEALLKQALALSKGQEEDVEMDAQGDGDEEMDEEEAIARAIQMSMETQQEGEKKEQEKKQEKKQ